MGTLRRVSDHECQTATVRSTTNGVPTIIAHCDIGHNLLQDGLSLRELLVLRLRRLQLGTELLDVLLTAIKPRKKVVDAPGSFHAGRTSHLDLDRS